MGVALTWNGDKNEQNRLQSNSLKHRINKRFGQFAFCDLGVVTSRKNSKQKQKRNRTIHKRKFF
jgi:hypothetical protein